MRSATPCAPSASVFGSRIANSSPPSRAARSTVRVAAASASARPRSTRSPVSWPQVSLTCLKSSMSRTITLSGVPRAVRALRLAPELGHEAAAVRQRGEVVGERLLLHEPVQVRVLERDLGLGGDPFRGVARVLVERPGAAVEPQHGRRPRLGPERHVEAARRGSRSSHRGSRAERRSSGSRRRSRRSPRSPPSARQGAAPAGRASQRASRRRGRGCARRRGCACGCRDPRRSPARRRSPRSPPRAAARASAPGISETDVARWSELGPSDANGTEAVTSPFATPVDHLDSPSTMYAKRTPGDAVLTAFSCASLGTTPAMTAPRRPAVDTTATCCTTARRSIEPTITPDRSLNAMFG